MVNLILEIVSGVIYLLVLASIPLRAMYIEKKAGKKIIGLKSKSIVLPVLILFFSAMILVIVAAKKMGFGINLIACLVAILGGALGSQEIALRNKCGIYENGLIGTGNFLPVKEIYGIQELGWTEAERDEHDKRVIHIITDKKGTVPYLCDDEEQAKEVIEGLKKICPSLKKD